MLGVSFFTPRTIVYKVKDRYQVEFAYLHQLLPIQCHLLHVDGNRKDGVRATADMNTGS